MVDLPVPLIRTILFTGDSGHQGHAMQVIDDLQLQVDFQACDCANVTLEDLRAIRQVREWTDTPLYSYMHRTLQRSIVEAGATPRMLAERYLVYFDDDGGNSELEARTVIAVVVPEWVQFDPTSSEWRLLHAIHEVQVEFGWPKAVVYVLRPDGVLEAR